MLQASINAVPAKLPSVLVCVCTYRRPIMLSRCLHSILEQGINRKFHMSIAVIDNDIAMSGWSACEAAMREIFLDTEIMYFCEPERGIALARNRGIDAAKEFKADYLAFIDDDDIAQPNWLSQLMSAGPGCDAVLGEVLFMDYLLYPRWKRPSKIEGRGAGNMLLSRAAFQRFRFQPSLGLGGGEDGLYLAALIKAGLTIKRNKAAITFGGVHPAKMTVGGILDRAYWMSAANMREEIYLGGWWMAFLRRSIKIIFAPAECVALLVIGLFQAPFRLERAKRKWLRALKVLAVAGGRIMGLIGRVPQSYKHTVGR